MKIFDVEFEELRSQFEKDFKISKNMRESENTIRNFKWFYTDSSDALFKAYMQGYAFAKCKNNFGGLS